MRVFLPVPKVRRPSLLPSPLPPCLGTHKHAHVVHGCWEAGVSRTLSLLTCAWPAPLPAQCTAAGARAPSQLSPRPRPAILPVGWETGSVWSLPGAGWTRLLFPPPGRALQRSNGSSQQSPKRFPRTISNTLSACYTKKPLCPFGSAFHLWLMPCEPVPSNNRAGRGFCLT